MVETKEWPDFGHMCSRKKKINPKNEWKRYHSNKGKGGIEGKKMGGMEKSGFLSCALSK